MQEIEGVNVAALEERGFVVVRAYFDGPAIVAVKHITDVQSRKDGGCLISTTCGSGDDALLVTRDSFPDVLRAIIRATPPQVWPIAE